MQDLFCSFISYLQNYSSLPVPDENYLNYHIFAVVFSFISSNEKNIWKV